MKTLLSILTTGLTFIFSLMGLSSCIYCAYGCPDTAYLFIGKVVDEENKPVGDVNVYMSEPAPDNSKNSRADIDVTHGTLHFQTISDSIKTNQDGEFGFTVKKDGCSKGIFLFIFDKQDYEGKDTVVAYNGPETESVKSKIRVVLEKKGEN